MLVGVGDLVIPSSDGLTIMPVRTEGPAQLLHTGGTPAAQAPHPRVRALCAAFPARSPLLPGRMCGGRAASVFPTSPPQRADWVRSGTLQLCSVSEKQQGKGD